MRSIVVRWLFYAAYCFYGIGWISMAKRCHRRAWKLALSSPAHSMDEYAKAVRDEKLSELAREATTEKR